MKKILLLFTCIFAVYSLSNAQTTPRKVLVESFTQASCGPCATQNPGFNALVTSAANYPKLTLLKYQTSWPGYDPMNLQNPGEVQTRVTFYGVTGVPNVRIDGTTNAGTSGSVSIGQIDNAALIPATLAMDVTHTLSADYDSIFITVTVTNVDTVNEFNTANTKLHTAIIEKELIFPTPPGSTNEVDFLHVMRKMLPGANGQDLGVVPPNSTLTFTFAEPLPDYIYDFSQIGVVSFVQTDVFRLVHQSEISEPLPLVGDFVDASLATATIGPSGLCAYEMTPQIEVTNEGDIDITSFDASYSLNGGALVTENWTGTLAPGASVLYTFPVVTLDPGSTDIDYEVDNYNGGLLDFNSLNEIIETETFNTLSVDAVFTDSHQEGFETVPNYAPAPNTIFIRAADANLAVVDASLFNNPPGPVGGFGQSNKSVLVNFYNVTSGSMEIVFDKIDLTNPANNNAFIGFDYTYRQYTTENDRMEVMVSNDCGASWDVLYNKAGSSLSTLPAATAFYVAVAGGWVSEEVDLTDYLGNDELVVKFRFTSAYGNNLYIDNINIHSDFVSGTKSVTPLVPSINVYPNPANGPVNIAFELVQNDVVSVEVYDIAGKLVDVVIADYEMNAGQHVVEWNGATAPGMYFAKIRSANGEATAKINVVK